MSRVRTTMLWLHVLGCFEGLTRVRDARSKAGDVGTYGMLGLELGMSGIEYGMLG